jgi:hypothetical protein
VFGCEDILTSQSPGTFPIYVNNKRDFSEFVPEQLAYRPMSVGSIDAPSKIHNKRDFLEFVDFQNWFLSNLCCIPGFDILAPADCASAALRSIHTLTRTGTRARACTHTHTCKRERKRERERERERESISTIVCRINRRPSHCPPPTPPPSPFVRNLLSLDSWRQDTN